MTPSSHSPASPSGPGFGSGPAGTTPTSGTTTPGRLPSAAVVPLSAVLTVAIGGAMSLQGHANGSLTGVLGNGVFAATVSFLGGLVVVALVALLTRNNRRTVANVWQLGRSGQFPWWMMLGGFGGSTVVISQAFTVPLFGVATFTMSFVCGQLLGALVVDNTSLPPAGRQRPTLRRVIGTLIVLVGVGISSAGVLAQGIAWWAPLLPATAGLLTAVQQACNGRLKVASGSTVASTFTNFLTGSFLLVVVSGVLLLSGTRIIGSPDLPGDWWMLMGGLYGLMFIGYSAIAVAHLGVLLLSLFSLLGNLLGSLAIDLTVSAAQTAVTWETYVSMLVVVLGVTISSVPRLPGLSRRARS
ncbi:DMT family transporter [Brevibacterium litoralis]|uniref:DMT family transporter n=1 Tax=Brevibacterium litoralis TaxID=3138935 RepID=UPI0032EF91A4